MPSDLVLVVDAPIARADIPGLCRRVRGVLDSSDARRVVCDVGAFTDPDAVTIDALAQLQLAAGRRGKSIVLLHANARLRALLELTGLADVLSLASDD